MALRGVSCMTLCLGLQALCQVTDTARAAPLRLQVPTSNCPWQDWMDAAFKIIQQSPKAAL